jgi:histidine triad (HIT) family protein
MLPEATGSVNDSLGVAVCGLLVAAARVYRRYRRILAKDIDGEELHASMSRSCVFCKIAARRAPAHVIDEDEHSLCLLDINPFTEGHCLVISKRHVPWWHDLSEQEVVSLFLMAKRVANRLGDVLRPDFVCLYARGRLDGFFNALERFQESPDVLAALKGRRSLANAAKKIRATRSRDA